MAVRTVEVEPTESTFREAHLRDYWKVVWQGRWTIAAIFLVVVGATTVWSLLQTPVFRATATIEVQPKARQLTTGQDVSGLGAAGYGWFAEEKYHNTQVEIIKSRDVALRVADLVDLRSNPRLAKFDDPVDAFRKRILVLPRRETGLIEISMMGTDPQEITLWVNEIAKVYVDRNIERARSNVRGAVQTIKSQMKELQEEFSVAETQRFEALQDADVFGSEDQVEIVKDKLKTYNEELTKVQLELSQLRNTLQKIASMKSEADLMTIPNLSQDEVLQELHRSKNALEAELESAKVDLKPGHPLYEKVVNRLANVDSKIQVEIQRIVQALRTDYELARDREKYISGQIRTAEDFSLRVARASSDYSLYKSRADVQKQILDLITKTMTEVQFGAEMLNNNVSVLDEATPPRYPIKPRKKLNVAIGAMLGLLLGLSAAFFLDYLDNTFRTPEDIEKHLALSVLGVIPKIQQKEGLSNRAVKEAYQSLRTSIIFSSKNRQRKLILVSSTGPQEGKSSTVANLGRMLAAAGDRVLIMDCDLRRPTQHLHHGVERDGGITNYLSAPVELTDWRPFVKSVGPNNLHLMSCGPIPPSPPELLGSERFSELLAELRRDYDWILVDSPPSSSLADSTLLASMVDMIVMVVQHNRTDRDLVAKTVARLRSVNKTVAGAVLNNVDMDRAYDKDYYYAGYYYYSEGEGKRVKKRVTKANAKANAKVG